MLWKNILAVLKTDKEFFLTLNRKSSFGTLAATHTTDF